MRIVTALLVVSAIAAGCSRSGAHAEAAFSAPAFLIAVQRATTSQDGLAILAAHRGRLPETRQLGGIIHREDGELRRTLAALAKKKNVPLPDDLESKKAALAQNLEILAGEVFDRGYALAEVQDLAALRAQLVRASRSGDADCAAFANRYLPQIDEQRSLAANLLKRLGGSPFH